MSPKPDWRQSGVELRSFLPWPRTGRCSVRSGALILDAYYGSKWLCLTRNQRACTLACQMPNGARNDKPVMRLEDFCAHISSSGVAWLLYQNLFTPRYRQSGSGSKFPGGFHAQTTVTVVLWGDLMAGRPYAISGGYSDVERFSSAVWCAHHNLWALSVARHLLSEADMKGRLWYLTISLVLGMEQIGIQSLLQESTGSSRGMVAFA